MSAKNNKDVIIEKLFDASLQNIWDAWTNAEIIKQWFGSDPNGTVTYVALDVKPGGFFTVTFKDSDGTEHTCSGVYKEVIPMQKLCFTWQWKSEPGLVSLVTVSFRHEEFCTRMLFTHEQLHASYQHAYQEGWQRTFGKLEKVINKVRS